MQGRSQPNTAGGGGAKKFQVGPNIYHIFLKFEVEIGAKARKKQKHNICCFLFCVIFQSNKIVLMLETHFRQIYISKWE